MVNFYRKNRKDIFQKPFGLFNCVNRTIVRYVLKLLIDLKNVYMVFNMGES